MGKGSGILEAAGSLWDGLLGLFRQRQFVPRSSEAAGRPAIHRMMRAYYDSNELFAELTDTGLMPIRNPTPRVVEFHASTWFPGDLEEALPLEVQGKGQEAILEHIRTVWRWSNFGARKAVLSRWVAIYGTAFLKVSGITQRDPGEENLAGAPDEGAPATASAVRPRVKRVHIEMPDPRDVVDLAEDERGNIVFCRIDVEQEPDPEDTLRGAAGDGTKAPIVTVTEIWSKAAGNCRIFRHSGGHNAPYSALGEPERTIDLERDLGIDFVPITHAKFRDTGELWGEGAVWHALAKINEACRVASRGHHMFFRYNRAIWALRANAVDAAGRPMAPPQITGSFAQSYDPKTNEARGYGPTSAPPAGARLAARSGWGEDGERVQIDTDPMVKLPGNSDLASLVPAIDYAAAQGFDDRMQGELERDLPELAYNKLRDLGGEITRPAMRLLLSDAIARAAEGRANAEDALVRVQQMALTIGKNVGLFTDIGSFEAGEYDHRFRKREILPETTQEREENRSMKANNIIRYREAGISEATTTRLMAEALDLENPDAELRASQQERQQRVREARFDGADPASVGRARGTLEAIAQRGNGSGGPRQNR